jgi:hypothetical protein
MQDASDKVLDLIRKRGLIIGLENPEESLSLERQVNERKDIEQQRSASLSANEGDAVRFYESLSSESVEEEEDSKE